MSWTLTIVTAVITAFLIIFLIDWRHDERTNPDTLFKGPAPIRFIKHIAMRIADGFLMGGP
ncbi:hypothetical protein [Octadecabacter ascidiaceicola]|uniref:Uncharacterized protein n=1 Tax=Octadecabacter ascidiaceicola TaxID=1655543 RepID=A0A238JJ96_9RHOB|nr:hypothetical protein [Octadecabacter ascidiaceicola]SMX30741.1 hypothetical protein OCA8868_00005 [Octadecabacter ascidiaceicola]